jgi:murein DD-endopeptidase MepM/ murein hydrolase activator NlpD
MFSSSPFVRALAFVAIAGPLLSALGRPSGAVRSAPRIGRGAARAASAAVVAVALSWSPPTPAAEPQPIEPEADAIFLPSLVSPIVWSPAQTPITAFAGTDGQYHLQYQLLITNATAADAAITDGDVLDPRTDQPTGNNRSLSADGVDIRLEVRLFSVQNSITSADFGDTIPAGQIAVMFFYLTYPSVDAIPPNLKHRFTAARTVNGVTTSYTSEDDDSTPVSTAQPVVLSPPLTGTLWMDANGSGPSVYAHRYTLQPTNGALRPPEVFAIDWIKLDDQGRMYVGDNTKNESYFGYGQKILSVSDGIVVEAIDGVPDQIPNHLVPPTDINGLAGNHVYVAIGDGNYAIYGHMKPGSVAVAVGQHVRNGQLLGLLGNSGSSTAPHLHFQISDAGSVTNSNGLPYVFDQMRYRASLVGPIFPTVDDMSAKGLVPQFDTSGAGQRRFEMPLQGDVIDFRQRR